MPTIDERTLRVEGLRELQGAFSRINKDLGKDVRDRLKDVAEPVRADAERLAVSSIRRVGIPWSRMRVGVTRTSVYVAPRERGKSSRANRRLGRPKFADLLLGRAMDPALDQNRDRIVAGMDEMLGQIGKKWER